MNNEELSLLMQSAVNLRSANYELEAERKKVADLEEQLRKQESMHLTEFFARRGDGDPYEGIERGGDLRLPNGWIITRFREDFKEGQEFEQLLELASPSGNVSYSRMRFSREGLTPSTYERCAKIQKTAVLTSALDQDYAQELRDRSSSIDGYHFGRSDRFYHRY